MISLSWSVGFGSYVMCARDIQAVAQLSLSPRTIPAPTNGPGINSYFWVACYVDLTARFGE